MKHIKFFDQVKRIDYILQKSDFNVTPELKTLLQDNVLEKYFFENNQNPDWLKSLFKSGLFEKPESVAFWPESRYLARMAEKTPEEVFKIIFKIPDTQNPIIHLDLAVAALAIQPALAAKLAKREIEWIEKQEALYLLLPDKYWTLATHLAKGGRVNQALKLAKALLDILPDPKAREKMEPISLPLEPKTKIDSWHYEDGLEKYWPELVKIAGIPALELLCDLLQQYIKHSERHIKQKSRKAAKSDKSNPLEDYSYIWRPEIKHDRYRDIRDCLVSGVRDSAEVIVKGKKAEVSILVKRLEKRPGLIFHRISLFLLSQFSGSAPKLVKERLLRRDLFEMLPENPEYGLLLKEGFKILNSKQQQVMLSWIEEGPNLRNYRKGYKSWQGHTPTPEMVEGYKKTWQRDKLAWFEKSLPLKWRERYQALVNETGEPKFESTSIFIGAGHRSPKTADELRAMKIEDLVMFIKNWKAPGSIREPTPEGLGQELTAIVALDPRRYTKELEKFKDLPLDYLHDVLAGYHSAVREKKEFEWADVLELCKWVVESPTDFIIPTLDLEKANNEKRWMRHTIADLISSGLEDVQFCIPLELRKTVWEILEPLTNDPNPPQENEMTLEDSDTDSNFASINTVRGKALHAVIRYGLWIRRYHDKTPEGKERAARGFEEMPEVRKVLKEHLDVTRDSSFAIRTVYGQWYPWLVLLDEGWAKDYKTKIFPLDDTAKKYWDAAWETYIVYCEAFDRVFEVLREEYGIAIERLGTLRERKGRLANPEERLAEHFMTMYWRGKLGDALLNKFYEKASPALKAHAIEYIGRSLEHTEGVIEPQYLKPIKALWEIREKDAQLAINREKYIEEIAAFGWWYNSGKFEDKWAMNHLLQALEIAKKINPDYFVIERLTEFAPKWPLKAIKCLKLLIEGNKPEFSYHGIRDKEIRDILKAAQQSSNKKAWEIADEIINTLGRMDRMEFRDLLGT